MPTATLNSENFDAGLLISHFGRSCCVEYLTAYLGELQATGVVIEGHYVDRHYLDDYVGYYAKSFDAPSPASSRVHFFSKFSKDQLEAIMATAYQSEADRAEAEKKLQEHYLGFVVRRPLKSARIGRTVLKTYPIDGRRHYEVLRPYRVHLAGLRLTIAGLAYQQQDGGAAVCASTSLWVALQMVAKTAGHRTPTPAAITEAAKSPYPASHGLNEVQMASALSSMGYIADYFTPGDNLPLFRAKLVSCLESQLPVILLLIRKTKTDSGTVTVGHAVTATGFSEPSSIVNIPSSMPGRQPIMMRSGSVEVLHVHDDNLGSHAHYEIFESDDRDADGNSIQMLRRGRKDRLVPWWNVDEWTVVGALVPKPDKLRLPVENLFSILTWIRPLLEKALPGLKLHFSTRFSTGVGYKRSLVERALRPSEVREFSETTALPRHIGIIAVYVDNILVLETVVDVTEIQRDREKPPVVGLVGVGVPPGSEAAKKIQSIADQFGVSLLTQPDDHS